MKRLSLEGYLEHPDRKVVTRDGRNGRIICTDAKCEYPVIALITICYEDDVYEIIESYTTDGCCSYNQQDSIDLFFAPEKHEGWVNVYKEDKFYNVGNLFSSKEDALAVTKGYNVYVATIKIEWEE